MPEEAVLEISFDINTIDHLGVKLYSTIPPMIALGCRCKKRRCFIKRRWK